LCIAAFVFDRPGALGVIVRFPLGPPEFSVEASVVWDTTAAADRPLDIISGTGKLNVPGLTHSAAEPQPKVESRAPAWPPTSNGLAGARSSNKIVAARNQVARQ
jgi:hypothetical protein